MRLQLPLLILFSFCGHLSYSQMVGVSFEVDTIFGEGAVDSWGESLEGYVTFDLFAELTNQEDQLSAVYSDVVVLNTPELYVEAPCGCYNPALGDVLVGGSQNELLFEFFPSIEYDTYWTLGFAEGEQAVLSNANYNSLSMCSETESGGLIFTITPVPAGDDLRVQFAQITTCGPFEVSACFQVFVNGVNAPYQEFCLETDGGGNLVVQYPFLGCTETTACNYDPSAFEDDGSCVPSGCLDPDAVNYNSDAGCDSGDCVYGGADNCGPGTYWDVEELKCLPNPFICGEGTYWNQLLLQCLPFDNCPEDLDNDGQVAVSDLLLLLGAYSEICPLIQGCTDSNALNYNPNAEEDDGSCVFEIFGCTDEAACNFQPLANTDDGSCQEFDLCGICGGQGPQIGYDCDGECLNDEDGDGVCDEFEVFGCTNEEADNFDIDATEDDGSCLISGCTAPVACNYNPEADVDDGSCLAFDQCGVCGGSGFPDGTCDCEGALPEEGYDCFGICLNDEDGDGVCDEFEIPGCDSVGACNFDSEATEDDGTCDFPDEGYDCSGVCLIDSDGDGICDLFEIVGCQDDSACNFAEEATDSGECFEFDECGECGGDGIIDGACDCEGNFPATGYDCNGDCLIDSDGDGICDEYEIEGCIFSNACNYDEAATDDDGSCFFYCPGCTDSAACNYDFDALQDDGTCQYPIDLYGASNVDCEGNCLSDEDGDGVCLEDEVFGCTDEIACNYSVDNTEEDDSCEYSSCAGCFDITACNYDPTATIEDDESCEYETCAGCMYEFACNYDPEATIANNGTCEFGSCGGCTDPVACNYNPTLSEDDGSCLYVPEEPLQLGNTIYSDFSYSDFGYGLSVSNDGSFVAIGDPYGDTWYPIDDAIPNVVVYELVNGDWTQRGSTLYPISSNPRATQFGTSVAISNDASVLIVGKTSNNNGYSYGHCLIYTWDGTDWDLLQSFNAPTNGYYAFGSAVSISGDGEFFAVSGPNSGNCYSGYVKVYQSNGYNYSEIGGISNPYYGTCGGPDWGSSISLSSDGSTLAVNSGYNYVHVYDVSEAGIAPKGDVLNGGSNGEVALSGNGDFLIIGTPGADQEGLTNSGKAEVFSWENGNWNALGQVILGDQVAEQVGWQVDISNSGDTIAIGARGASSGDAESFVEIYTIEEGTWIPTGPVVDAPSESSSYYELNIVLSGDGGVLGVGNYQEAEVLIFNTNPPCIGPCGGDGIIDGACDCEGNFPATGYDCEGNCLSDSDGDGVCDEFEVAGCTDEMACNYNMDATDEDGSCLNDSDGDGVCDEFEVAGCTDEVACNYNVDATDEDGSCTEFDECGECGGDGITEGACDCEDNFPATGYDCEGNCLSDSDGDGVCDEFEVAGCTDEVACNYNVDATDEDGSCTEFDECGECGGDGITEGACDCEDNFPATGYDCEGNCLSDSDGDGVCDEFEILGCTHSFACNFQELATEDDSTCEFQSCPELTEEFSITISEYAYPDSLYDVVGDFITYRIHLHSVDTIFHTNQIFGDSYFPLALQSTSIIYQDPFGLTTACELHPGFFGILPSAEYDSYITIGAENWDDCNESGQWIVTYDLSGENWADTFDEGGNISVNEGGGWFSTVSEDYMTEFGSLSQTYMGSPGVLIAQVTSDGLISGEVNAQVYNVATDEHFLVSFSIPFIGPGVYQADSVKCECSDN